MSLKSRLGFTSFACALILVAACGGESKTHATRAGSTGGDGGAAPSTGGTGGTGGAGSGGSAGGACAPRVDCASGACDMGWADCDADPLDGCETSLASDATNCGACGRVCTAPARAAALCVDGQCSSSAAGAGGVAGSGPAAGGVAGSGPAAGAAGTTAAAAAGRSPDDVCDPGAPCQGVPCPGSIPEAGRACGSAIAMCPYDTCTSDGGGHNFNAVCNGGTWSILDAGCLKCCADDSDCDGTLCVQSRCVSREHEPGCFSDEECAPDEMCAGAYVCQCGSPVGCKGDTPGECVPAGIGCCGVDADCAADEVCLLGVCKAVPGDGLCWRDDECEFYCNGPELCPCGQSCAGDEMPGGCGFPG